MRVLKSSMIVAALTLPRVLSRQTSSLDLITGGQK